MKTWVLLTLLLFLPKTHATDISSSIEMTQLPGIQLQGEKIKSIEELKGKVVLVDFWASWCEPCKEALPHYNKFYEAYKKQGLVVLAVNEDDDLKDRDQYLKKNKILFPVFADEKKEAVKQFKVAALPTLYILDKNLKAVAVFRGYSPEKVKEIKNKIEELIKK